MLLHYMHVNIYWTIYICCLAFIATFIYPPDTERAKRRERWALPLSHCLLKHLALLHGPSHPGANQAGLNKPPDTFKNCWTALEIRADKCRFKPYMHNKAIGWNPFLLTPFNLSFSVPLLYRSWWKQTSLPELNDSIYVNRITHSFSGPKDLNWNYMLYRIESSFRLNSKMHIMLVVYSIICLMLLVIF